MQVRYQAALRPETRIIADRLRALTVQDVEYRLDFFAHGGEIGLAGRSCVPARLGRLRHDFIQPVARAADGEALIVQKIPNAPDQQNFMVLIITPVAAPLDGLQLRELLLPIAQ